MTKRGIGLSAEGIALRSKVIPFLSGSAHYWRLEPSKWRLVLENFKDLGFTILQTYVPWSVHETTPGNFDFGEMDEKKNLGAFLDLCEEVGLYVFIRPGPHINAEITHYGYPVRLFENPENLAMSATGQPAWMAPPPRAFPIISYASEQFYSELALFFDAVAKTAVPRCYPDGPIIGIQSDNEMSFLFRTGTYDMDYSHWAKEMYTAWLKEKYGDLETVSRTYGQNIASFSAIPMPTRFGATRQGDLPYYIDWAQFKEELLARPLSRIWDMLADRGFEGLLCFHNYPTNPGHTPFNISRSEKDLDIVGVDFYNKATQYAEMRKKLLHLCGTSRFPVSPEFASGCFPAWAPIDLADQRFTTFLALACGLKGINFYMIVERERWYGSPILANGELRDEYADFYRRLSNFIAESDLFSMTRKVDAVLLRGRIYDRLEKAADLFSPVPYLGTEQLLTAAHRCHEGKFDFDYMVQIDHETVFDAWYDELSSAKIPFTVSDTDIDQHLLGKYKVAFVPSFEFMDREAQQKLHKFSQNGGTLVMGPSLPTFDETMSEFSTLDNYAGLPIAKLDCVPDTVAFNVGAGRIVMVNGLPDKNDKVRARMAGEIFRFVNLEPIHPASGVCETTVFITQEGRKLIFLINPTNELRRPRIPVSLGEMFRDYLTAEEFYGADYISVEMDPYSVRPLEVKPC